MTETFFNGNHGADGRFVSGGARKLGVSISGMKAKSSSAGTAAVVNEYKRVAGAHLGGAIQAKIAVANHRVTQISAAKAILNKHIAAKGLTSLAKSAPKSNAAVAAKGLTDLMKSRRPKV